MAAKRAHAAPACSPFADILGEMGSEAPAFYGELTGMKPPHVKHKPEPMVIVSEVTLEELYNAATKKVSYTRKKLKPDGMVRRPACRHARQEAVSRAHPA